MGVAVEEAFGYHHITFAYFSQHPAYCLVDEILRVLAEEGRNGRTVVSLFDKIKSSDDSHPTVPEVRVLGKVVEEGGILPVEVPANNVVGRGVDQIPVVNLAEMSEVEVEDGLPLLLFVGLWIPVHQDDEGQKPLLMDGGVEETFDGREGGLLEALGDGSQGSHPNADENIALTIVTRACFEVALVELGPFCALMGVEGLFNRFNVRHGL